jgi:hypothetical protein
MGIGLTFSRGTALGGVKPATHLNVVPTLRMSGTVPFLPPFSDLPSWRSQGQFLYLPSVFASHRITDASRVIRRAKSQVMCLWPTVERW